MTLSRKALGALLAALLTLMLSRSLGFTQTLPGLYWPSTITRVLVYVGMSPALVTVHWTELHWGQHPPLWACYWLVWFGYFHLYGKLRSAMSKPLKVNRRALFVGAGAVAAAGCGTPALYPTPHTRTQRLSLRDLPDSLVGLRLVLVSDLHRGPVISQSYLEAVVDTVNRLKPDLVLMPGDFVSRSASYFAGVTQALTRLRPSIASVATLGNHDNWEGTDEALDALNAAGVIVLHNRSVHLNPDRTLSEKGERGLCLAGVDDLGSGKPDLALALSGVSSKVPRLLLSHNPDLAEDEEATKGSPRVDLQLSGHTHGGQIVLPGVGPLVSGSRHGLKYLAGWAQGPHWPVFVTRGIGTSLVPVRVGADPEILVFELARQGLTVV